MAEEMIRSSLKPSTKPMKRSGFKPSVKPLPGLFRTADLPEPSAPKLAYKPRMRKCAICRTPFRAFEMRVKWCGPDCGAALAQRELAKKAARIEKNDRAETRQRLVELKPKKWWKAKAKTALHAYVRARDEGKPCISCDTILVKLGRVGGDYDAGHFRSVGSAKHLEFVENNIHGQCKHCNDYLASNRDEYERRLGERYGVEFVEALKADQEPRHLTIDDYKAIEVTYKAKLKEFKAGET